MRVQVRFTAMTAPGAVASLALLATSTLGFFNENHRQIADGILSCCFSQVSDHSDAKEGEITPQGCGVRLSLIREGS
jgi:hypothetical protein